MSKLQNNNFDLRSRIRELLNYKLSIVIVSALIIAFNFLTLDGSKKYENLIRINIFKSAYISAAPWSIEENIIFSIESSVFLDDWNKNNDELIYIIGGSGEHLNENRVSYKLKKGEIVLSTRSSDVNFANNFYEYLKFIVNTSEDTYRKKLSHFINYLKEQNLKSNIGEILTIYKAKEALKETNPLVSITRPILQKSQSADAKIRAKLVFRIIAMIFTYLFLLVIYLSYKR